MTTKEVFLLRMKTLSYDRSLVRKSKTLVYKNAWYKSNSPGDVSKYANGILNKYSRNLKHCNVSFSNSN